MAFSRFSFEEVELRFWVPAAMSWVCAARKGAERERMVRSVGSCNCCNAICASMFRFKDATSDGRIDPTSFKSAAASTEA